MRNKIIGAIVLLWGSGVIVSYFMRGVPRESGPEAMGEKGALVVAVCMVIGGALTLFKRSSGATR